MRSSISSWSAGIGRTVELFCCGFRNRQGNQIPLDASGHWFDRRKQNVYILPVIRSFANNETERFYTTGKSRRVPSELRGRAVMRLTQLNAATRIEDLRLPPSNRLEMLKGGRKGQWSIRINDQWRVCFRFEKGDAFSVEIVDYH